MDLTLKNYKPTPSQSRGSDAYTADVYVDGNKAFHARNDGNGGSDMFTPFEGGRELLVKAESWAESLPDIDLYGTGAIPSDLEVTLERVRLKADFASDLRKRANQSYKKVQFIIEGDVRSFTKSQYKEGMPLEPYLDSLKSKKDHEHAFIVNSLPKKVAIEFLTTYYNGEIPKEDRLDQMAEILIEQGNIEPSDVEKALGIELHALSPK